jgi:hypothetical protein
MPDHREQPEPRPLPIKCPKCGQLMRLSGTAQHASLPSVRVQSYDCRACGETRAAEIAQV